ncbi:MAG: ammonium transporter [Limnobacter sp.]|jgi:ammonium transporter, Amt family|uniref:Ammonium transporter n=1 Tax=Limnobacter profundi TaxID=2732163 RepID=A0ABX6N8A5_9BURK|nr:MULTISPECIES: ammonium transporter [unclassified Limnobacter]MBA4315395.1 ammonium transporter [Alcaligenaceae bacterium]PZO15027.1 MAG: ammonium transporter [Betaproteobacteria bacterium]MDP3271043.1 ammonium transporter [Limnobacter sp.]MDZ4050041.1 ammonium transporter [Limnobacter sp.]PZO28595.1 MAG: ammonium transporter [Betaproteobacteria bacterium]
MEQITLALDTLFVLLGAIMVLAMHAGFAFLEVGTVRHKNQVNALVKILADFSVSTISYFFIGYAIAYGVGFYEPATVLNEGNGYSLVKFFFLLTFAAAIPAIVSGGIAERARFVPQLVATAALVGLVYPVFEGMVWNGNYGFQEWLTASFGAPFMDFAGSVVVHAVGGWIALAAVLLLGSRRGRYTKDGRISSHPPSSIPFLALGSWVLAVGWFGFNVMSAQKIEGISGLVAVNSLMAMVGGTLGALAAGRNDPGFAYNGPLAGLVAVCAGSNIMHPLGSLAVGSIAGVLFVYMFTFTQNRLKVDDVLGVWPLHGICGAFGGIAAGVFGQQALGGMGGVSFMSQLIGTVAGVAFALLGGFVVYGLLKMTVGIRLNDEEEFNGADLTIHKVSASPERETSSW